MNVFAIIIAVFVVLVLPLSLRPRDADPTPNAPLDYVVSVAGLWLPQPA